MRERESVNERERERERHYFNPPGDYYYYYFFFLLLMNSAHLFLDVHCNNGAKFFTFSSTVKALF